MARALFAAVFGFLLLVTPAAAAEKWTTYTNTEYGFSMSLPGEPVFTEIPTENATVMHFAFSDSWRSYGGSVIPLKEGQTYNLDKGVAGAVAANNGTVTSDEAITVQGYPARKVKYMGKSGDTVVTTWFVLVSKPGMVYTVMTAQFGQVKQDEVDRVLNSLRILE